LNDIGKLGDFEIKEYRMKNWTERHIRQLKDDGKIMDFSAPQRMKGFSSDKVPPSARHRTKALDWLGWNLLYWCNEHALTLETEYRFSEDRLWRFDWAIASIKVAIEFEGGIFMEKSGHTNVAGMVKDSEKYNKAAVMGWKVIRVTALNYATVLRSLDEILNS
jgi:hypothetical protein